MTIVASTRLGACRVRFRRGLVPPKPVLGASWPHLGCFWAALGRSWVCLGHLLQASWTLLVASGLSWVPPASILDVFGASGLGVGELHWQFSPLFLAMPFSCRHGFYVMHELLRSTARHSTAQGQH